MGGGREIRNIIHKCTVLIRNPSGEVGIAYANTCAKRFKYMYVCV